VSQKTHGTVHVFAVYEPIFDFFHWCFLYTIGNKAIIEYPMTP